MPITNTDTIPAVTVDIADGQLGVDRPQAGIKLTLMGTTTSQALDVRAPVFIDNSPLAMQRVRHADGSPSELSMGLAEAKRVGARNVEVVKIATLSGELDTVYTPNDRFDDLEAVYKDLKLHPIDIVVPINAYLDTTGLSGSSPDGQTRSIGFHRQLGNFCYQATKEWNSCIGVLGVRPLNKVARDEGWAGAQTGDPGEFFNDPPIAHVREWPKHLRDEAGDLVDHSAEGLLTTYIAGSIESAPGQISPSYDGWAQDTSGSTATDRNGVNVDGLSYIMVSAILARIATDETQNLANAQNLPNEVDQHVLCGGAVGLGALLTTLDSHEGATGKSITGYRRSRALPYTTANELIQARIVTMVDQSGTFTVSKGMTAGYNGSRNTRTDYNLMSTRRIMHDVVEVVRTRGRRYIGRPITGPNIAALEADVRSGLNQMKPSGALQRHEMNVTSSPDDQVLGEVNVNLALVVGHELVKINGFTQLQKPDAL